MKRLPVASFFLAILVGIALVVGGYFLWFEDRGVFVPVPFLQPLNDFATLQWEPVKKRAPSEDDDGTRHPGFEQAKIHCVRCHSLPDPQQLPKETWPFVLTWMSNYLGYTNTYVPFGNNVDRRLMPAAPLLTELEFQQLAEYYLLFSPDRERLTPRPGQSRNPTKRFVARNSQLNIPNGELVTFAHFDEVEKRFLIGRGASSKALQVFDRSGSLLLDLKTQSEPIDVDPIPSGFRVTMMGDFMEDQLGGKVVDVTLKPGGHVETKEVITGYHRLTESHTADLDADGIDDVLLVGFGAGSLGKVSVRWFESEGATAGETILIDYAGALNAHIHDFDRDGLDDVMLLTAQSKQELLLFLNQGGQRFEKRLIHQEFAGFGYNHLSLSDFNEDGWLDLLIANGNNMEIKDAPLKPYHGIRILENNRDLTFSESFFYPMYGALKALASDFDRDGDQDIAAIAFYPNWDVDNPESFVYLENQGNNVFHPTGLEQKDSGRWITMALGDVDQDGWRDVILGGGYILQGVTSSHRDAYSNWIRTRPSVVVLENIGGRDPGLD